MKIVDVYQIPFYERHLWIFDLIFVKFKRKRPWEYLGYDMDEENLISNGKPKGYVKIRNSL